MGTRQNPGPPLFTCTHLFVVVNEDEVGGVLSRDGDPWGDWGKAARVNDSVRVPGHGG